MAPNNRALNHDGYTGTPGLFVGGVYVVAEEYLTRLENNHWVRKPGGTWKQVHDVPYEDLDGLEVLDFRAGDKVQHGVFLGINYEGVAEVETPEGDVIGDRPLNLEKAKTQFKVGGQSSGSGRRPALHQCARRDPRSRRVPRAGSNHW